MNWKHPEAIIRTRIAGKTECCDLCRHMTEKHRKTQLPWCTRKRKRPKVSRDFGNIDDAEFICEKFNDEGPQ